MRLFIKERAPKASVQNIDQSINQAVEQEVEPDAPAVSRTKRPFLMQSFTLRPLLLRPLLLRLGLTVGGIAVVGGISGGNWAISHVRTELAPRITQELQRLMERPIQLGEIEQVSWSGIRLGRTVIPATATDADQVTIEAVDVRFDPIQALQHQQLKLTVTLVRPTAYFDQDKSGQWVNVALSFDETEQIEVEKIQLQDATLTLAPQPLTLDTEPLESDEVWNISDHPTQAEFQQVNGFLNLQDQGKRLRFEVSARPKEPSQAQGQIKQGQIKRGQIKQGQIKLSGDARLPTDQIELAVETKALKFKSLAAFIPTDIKVSEGQLDAKVTAQIQPDQLPHLTGWAELQNLALRAKGEPNPFSNIQGHLQIQGQDVVLQQGQIQFGQIPFTLAGKINLQQGFDLKAQVAPLDVLPFMQTLELEVPFPVKGSLEATDLRLTGSFAHPTLSGTAHAVRPIQLDRLTMASTVGQFSLDLGTDHLQLHHIQAIPVTGGSVTAAGELWLEEDNANLTVDTKLPVDAIAQLYGLNLDGLNLAENLAEVEPQINLGQLQSHTQITVVAEEPSLTAAWQLQGRYPASGKVTLAQDILRIQDTAVEIGPGQLAATGELKQGKWQVGLQGTEIPLSELVGPILPGDLQGQLQGKVRVSGKTEGLRPEAIQIQGEAVVQLAQGAITARLGAEQGAWQGNVSGTIPLTTLVTLPDTFSSSLQDSLIESQISLKGDLAQLSLAQTQAEGQIKLSKTGIFASPFIADFAWMGDRLHLKQATADNVVIDGWVTPALNSTDILSAQLGLNVNIKDYDLAKLPLPASLPIAVAGLVNLDGTVSGTPKVPQINSNVQLDRLAIQGDIQNRTVPFRFEPLRGQIKTQPNHQIALDLKGHQDRIALTLDPNYRPTEFAIQQNQATAQGQLSEQRLQAQIRNFDLTQLNLMPVAALGSTERLRGLIASNIEVNLADQRATATLDINQLGLGNSPTHSQKNHQADRFTGILNYQNGVSSLSQSLLKLGSSSYQIAAQIDPNQQYYSQVAVEQGQIQDLLTLLPAETLTHLLQQVPTAESLPIALPTPAQLARLDGTFSGILSLQGSSQTDPTVQFGFQGQNWRVADYGIQQVAVTNGEWNGQTLTLPSFQASGFALPLNGSPQQFNAELGFSGQISPDDIAGQLQLQRLNLPQIQSAFNLPLNLTGQVHALATLSGHPSQPEITGELHLAEVNLHDLPIQSAKIGFSYINQQFHLESWN